MNILVVCQYYYPEQFRINDICETLVQAGHKVTVLTGLPNYPMGEISPEYKRGKKRREYINGVEVIRCFEIGRKKGSLWMMLNYISYTLSASFKVLFLNKDFDVVFINQLSPVLMAIPGIIYAKKNKKKTLLYSLDLWPESLTAYHIGHDSFIYKIMLKVSRLIYQSADFIAATSKEFKTYFSEVLNIDKPIAYLPQYAEDLFKREDKINGENRCNLLFAGNIGTVQSVDTIIKAARILKNETSVVFHIVGDGSEYENCQKMASDLKNVTFYGRHPLSDMPRFYNMADAMLVTLKKDKLLSYTLPGKVQTYMAAGKPIIGAIDGETAKIVEEAACGYCVPSGDSVALAEAIRTFYSNFSKWDAMGNHARRYYEVHFDKSVFTKRLNEYLEGLCKDEVVAD